jgi:L-asparaginase II
MRGAAPVLAEFVRGGMVESSHRGSAVVCDAEGRILMSWGDAEQHVYARSALKPLQAMPLVETGAADAFGLGPVELALACGSHHGEAHHVAAVRNWLGRIGCTADDLECGAHRPIDPDAADALVRAGERPSALHNNCSGKHAGFLATARHLGQATRGYIDFAHPVQSRVIATVAAMTGRDLSNAARGVDGCGIPVVAVPLSGLARAMARMGDRDGLPHARAEAARRLLAAMAAEPLMVSGSTGFATALLRAAGAAVVAKPGAEGVFAAALPRQKLGLALKIDDGAGRAAEVALCAILLRLGALDRDAAAALGERLRPKVRNVAGLVVGELRPGSALAPP